MGKYSVKLVNLVSVVSCNMVKLFNQLQVLRNSKAVTIAARRWIRRKNIVLNERERAIEISRMSISDTATFAAHHLQLDCSSYNRFVIMVKNFVFYIELNINPTIFY
jgi:hypothetical protein